MHDIRLSVHCTTLYCTMSSAVVRGGQCPHHESLCLPPANFRNLANLEEALEKIQWCFYIWPFLTSKAFTNDHLSHVLIIIIIVFLLRTDCTCILSGMPMF